MLGPYSGRQLLGIRYLPPFPYFMDSPNAFRVLPARVRQHRGRHRHRAPVARLRRGRQGDRRRRRHRRRHPGRLQGPLRRDRARLRGPARVRRQPADHPGPQERHRPGRRQRRGAAAARDLRPLLPALLAVPESADLPGGVVVVRQGHRVPGPHGRTQPADHLVPRARQGRPVRQVAVRARGTGRSRETATGAARFRCGSPTIRRIRGSTCTAASTNSSATSACVRTICTGPTSTNSPGQSRRPDRSSRPCGASRTCSTSGSTPGRCRTRRCTTRSRTRNGSMESAVRTGSRGGGAHSRRLHRRVHRPDPRLVLHAARAGDRAVRPAGVPDLRVARHRAGQRRPEDEQVAAQLPRRDRGVRPRRLGRDALVPDGVADPARREPDRHRAGHPRGRAPGAAAVLERLHFLALYAPKKGTWRTDSANVLDRYILAKLAVLRDDLTESLDVCDISGACDELRQFTEALTNWYVRRSRSRFWEEDPDAIDTLHTVLEVTGRLAAPLLPLIAEVIWRGITGERSVHLTDWPGPARCPPTRTWWRPWTRFATCARRRRRCARPRSCGCACRCRNSPSRWRTRTRLRPFVELIADELNVKEVELSNDIDAYGRFELTVNARVAGPRLGKDVQAAIKAVKAGAGVVNPDGTLTAGPATLLPEEYSSKLVAAEPEWTASLPEGAGLVVLDGTVTPGARSRGLGQGPHPRASGAAQVHRSRRIRPDRRRHLGARRTGSVGAHSRRPDRRRDPGHQLRVRRARRRDRNR